MFPVSALEQRMEEQLQAAHVPGAALAIVQHREIIYAHGFGTTSVEDGGVAVTAQTLFRIGSTTKPLTGTAILRLVEAGKLDLDRPVHEYVPWLAFGAEGAGERITLRMLLSHTTGLPFDAPLCGHRDLEGLDSYLRKEWPLVKPFAPPGEIWLYSNLGLDLVGYILETVFGKYYPEVMQELIFTPLEMRRTTFDIAVAMTYPIAQSHQADSEGRVTVKRPFWDQTAGNPSSGAMSTVLDLAHFAILHLNHGSFQNRTILSPHSIQAMRTPHANLYTPLSTSCGLTFFIHTYKGIRRVEHWGGADNFSSRFVMAPEAGVAVILLHNRMASPFDPDSIVDAIFDRLLGLPPQEPPPPFAEANRLLWPHFVGTYQHDEERVATIEVNEDRLLLLRSESRIPLSAYRHDLYVGEDPASNRQVTVGFVGGANDKVKYLLLDTLAYKRVL